MGIKKLAVDFLSIGLTAKGFTGGEARLWVRESHRHKVKQYGYTKKQTRWALKHGFMPEQVEKLGVTADNADDFISAKDYAFLRPLNGIYSKWITDKITVYNIFKPFRKYMPEIYFQISRRYDDTFVIPIADDTLGTTLDDVARFIMEKGEVTVAAANGIAASTVEFADGQFVLDGSKYDEAGFKKKIGSYEQTLIIKERVKLNEGTNNAVLNLIVFNEFGDNPVIGDAYYTYDQYEQKTIGTLARKAEDSIDEADQRLDQFIDIKAEAVDEKTGIFKGEKIPHWDEITEVVKQFCVFVPQLEFFAMEIIISEEGFKIVGLSNHPIYPTFKPFGKQTTEYLKRKVAQKKKAYSDSKTRRKRGSNKVMLRLRKWFARAFFPTSLVPYQSIRWPQDVKHDFKTNKEASFKEKMWAYKRGFLSYRIKQYGITDENRDEYISDFEYRWLRHINPKYRKWMEDKITVKYICSDFNNCFPEYYFHIICKNGYNKVISMMDLPKQYTNEFEDIFKLVQEKKVLALKPDEGSHGDGFYKFTCEFVDGEPKYQLNYKDAAKEEILAILENVENQYLVTEYISQCDEFNAINPGAVNTVRMIVFKKDGIHPEVGNAYIRIGSQKTGAVDNVGAGGMTAHIDVETGKYDGALIAIDNQIKEIYVHPDTGVELKGIVPHWEQVKKNVLDVAYSIKQLEWFGFDLAVTNEGIKFPEINRFPDYPSVEKYNPNVREYLLGRLKAKKQKFGYNNNKNKTLVHLPRRNTL